MFVKGMGSIVPKVIPLTIIPLTMAFACLIFPEDLAEE